MPPQMLDASLPVVLNYVAKRAGPADLAVAHEAELRRCRYAKSVDARLILARVQRDLTVLSGVATLANAAVAVDVVDARAVVGAQVVLTVVDLYVAVGPRESRRAAARLGKARSSVVAAAVAQEIVRTFRVNLGRNDFGVAVAEPVGAAYAHARRVTGPVAIHAVVARNAADVAVGAPEVLRTHGLASDAVDT